MVINETINATAETFAFHHPVLDRFFELVMAPIQHENMLWITLPLILALFLMQLYFSRYHREELGWNTAVGNSMALIFVSMDLFRYLYNNAGSTDIIDVIFADMGKFIIVSVISLISFWLLFGEFFHILPKKFAFFVSSSLPTTLVAYLGIVLVYTEVPMDLYTLWAALMLFVVLVIFFGIIKVLMPFHMTKEEKLALLNRRR